MIVVILLPIWVITVPKSTDNSSKRKGLTGILNFVVHVQDYKSSDRIVKCFKCQNFWHKTEFCHIKDRCVKCAGNHNIRLCNKEAAHSPRCANCGGQHFSNYQGSTEAQKYKERRGTPRTPSQPQQGRKPDTASRVEYPSQTARAATSSGA